MENFEILGRERIYSGRAFNVAKLTAKLPNGQTRQFDLVEHADSVTVIPVDGQGRVLFVRQYRTGAEDALLELPAGVFNEGEEPETCAAREVREETGFAAGKLELLGSYYLAPGYCDEMNYAYLATGLYDSPLEQDEDEFLETEAIPVAEAYAMAERGEIEDGKSLAALLLARSRLLG